MSDEQDKAKLHAEINQYINQCFTISMTAITVFGAIGGLILGVFTSSLSGGSPPPVKPITFLLSIFLVIILSVLFYVLQTTINNLLVLAAYLHEKKLSSWEVDFEKFRSQSRTLKHVDQEESRTLLFLVLGISSLFFPLFIIPFGFQNNWVNGICLLLHIFISVAFCIIVYNVIRRKWFRFQNKQVEDLWKAIISASKS